MPASRWIVTALMSAGSLALPAPARSQTLAILDSNVVRLVSEEISGDAAYTHIRYMSQFHRPRGGSDELMTVARYLEEQARQAGLEDVRLIKQASTTKPWNARFADLWIVDPTPERIASTLQSALHLADYSRAADVTAELVDINAGTEADYAGRSVQGKIVLTYGPLASVVTEAVIRRGALGIVWYPSPYSPPNGIVGAGVSRPDQIRWNAISADPIDGREPGFAFTISLRQGVELHNRLQQATAPIRVQAKVDAGFTSREGEQPWQVMVEAYIRGTDPSAGQDIVLTGHMQEGLHSVNDDASGCASVLEIGRALMKLINEGRLPRPQRSIRLWWVTEISSQRQYFADHPDAHRQMWVNVNQDMVGADQSLDVMRVQNVTRVPATRFHFLNDVMEAVLDYMVASNNFELAQLQAGIPFYPRPYFARGGSMHRYNAKAIWFHENTDHMTFNEAPIGVPGVSFTNMPDRFIHSNEDDLWNVDRTQLGRNAVSVALIALRMATADRAAFGALAAEVVGRGGERLAQNLRLALSWLATRADLAVAYHDATDQIRYAAERERMAVRSLAQIAPGLGPPVAQLVAEVDRRATQAERDVQLAYRQRSGEPRAPAARTLGTDENALAAVRPVLAGGPREFLTGRGTIAGAAGLHALMATEVLAAVDGTRSGLDVFRYVAGEAREAGPHYYGVVTPQAVLRYLQNAERAGLVRLERTR
ncbi:MAG TPA: M28 family peptidase [Gemmatimonadaceae bacterium]|nr:M28 family peptidase [Gemmatimonadaceae bacterium]